MPPFKRRFDLKTYDFYNGGHCERSEAIPLSNLRDRFACGSQ